MAFTLDKVVPWGRTFDEYIAMFDLSDDDLKQRILGCGDGPAAFNAELTRRGGRVISIDPVYAFDCEQISSRIAETYDTVLSQLNQNREDYVWTSITSVEELGRIRMAAMGSFLADYEAGTDEGRYIEGELPTLPFENESFELALSSHFLFLYSAHLSTDFHLQALQEMLRVAREVRVFPLLALDGKSSPYMEEILKYLHENGFDTEIRCVSYEFQQGGNEMLVIKGKS